MFNPFEFGDVDVSVHNKDTIKLPRVLAGHELEVRQASMEYVSLNIDDEELNSCRVQYSIYPESDLAQVRNTTAMISISFITCRWLLCILILQGIDFLSTIVMINMG